MDNSPFDVVTLGIMNKPSAKHLIGQFSTLLDVTQKTDVQRLGCSFKNAGFSHQAVLYVLACRS